MHSSGFSKYKMLRAQSVSVSSLLTLLLFWFNISLSMAMSDTPDTEEKNWVPEVADARQDIQSSKAVIEEVKSKEPFVNIQQKRIWDFSDDEEPEVTDVDYLWLSDLFGFLAIIIEAALWVLPVLLLLYLYRYREYCLNLLQGRGFKRDQHEIPETLFGLDMRQKSLPDNIEDVARALWQDKNYREAVSLLYRGSLVSLFKQYKFELSPGATEQDCIRQIELSEKNKSHTQNAVVDYQYSQSRIERFKHLTGLWIEIAYAHRQPEESVFALVCNGWNQLFADNGGAQ